MNRTAFWTVAILGVVAALADIGEAGTANVANAANARQVDWIERHGLDREKATRLMMDFVCETRDGMKDLTKDEWARKFIGVVMENMDDLKTQTIPFRFDPAASNHCLRAVRVENGTMTPGCYFVWDGSNATRRVFRSHQFPNGRFVFASDYKIANSRFMCMARDGFDLFKPTRTDDGAYWCYRSLAHPDRCFLVQGCTLSADVSAWREKVLNGK